ncbi:GGDEF domain-containing protein, partial [Klebsiella oxytoca]
AEACESHSGMRSVQNLEAVINEGLRVSLLKETPDQSLKILLKYLGKALNGDRTYIFERSESGYDDNTYEWTADGVEPEID